MAKKSDKSNEKTNVMRLLDKAGIPYEPYYYQLSDEDFSGEEVSRVLGIEPERCFKSLCAKGRDGRIFLCVIPVNRTLNLKKAAAAAGEKSIEMLAVRDLRATVGYERGSVSPVGTKKAFPTFIDRSALEYEQVEISGGAKGASVMLNTRALGDYTRAIFADLCD